MKKTICILSFLLALVLSGCSLISKETALKTSNNTKNTTTSISLLETPKNLKIVKGIVSFDEVNGATSYSLKVMQDGELVLNMTIKNGDDISSNFDDGDYTAQIRSINENKKSEFSEAIEFHIGLQVLDVTDMNEISGDELTIEDYINYSGRTYYNKNEKRMYFYYTASGFKVSFTGTKLEAKFYSTKYNTSKSEARLVILVDGEIYPDEGHTLVLNKDEESLYTLVEGLENKKHTVEVLKRTESSNNTTALKYLKTDGNFESPDADKEKRILLIGASGSAGHGSIGLSSDSKQTCMNSDGLRAFPYLTARMYDTEIDEINASGWGCYWGWNKQDGSENIPLAFTRTGITGINSVTTKTYDYTKDKYDLIIVNLGMNDFNAYIKNQDINKRDSLIETYKEKTYDFYKLLTSTYDCKIVLLHTSNTNSLAEGIYNEEIAKKVNDELGETRIYSIIIPANGSNGNPTGANSHANVGTHIETANLISKWIENNLKWTKVRENITYDKTRDLSEINVIE